MWAEQWPQVTIVGTVVNRFTVAVTSVLETFGVITVTAVLRIRERLRNVITTFYIALNRLTHGSAELTAVSDLRPRLRWLILCEVVICTVCRVFLIRALVDIVPCECSCVNLWKLDLNMSVRLSIVLLWFDRLWNSEVRLVLF